MLVSVNFNISNGVWKLTTRKEFKKTIPKR